MKLNNIKVLVTELPGNLRVITIPNANSKDQDEKNRALYTLLRLKCGGGKPTVLSEPEQKALPDGINLVFTYDSYTRLIPYYCDFKI